MTAHKGPHASPPTPIQTLLDRLVQFHRRTISTITAMVKRVSQWGLRIAGVSLLLAVVALVELTGEIANVAPFDERVTSELARRRSDTFTNVVETVTTLADATTVLVVAAVAVAGAWRKGGRRVAAPVLGAILTTTLVVAMMKGIIGRDRPLPPIRLSNPTTASYPSGHSAQAVSSWGSLIWVLCIGRSPTRKALGAAVAATIALCVGFSRVYLGVHWASDVVAGWAVGGICLTAMMLATSGVFPTDQGLRSGLESEREGPMSRRGFLQRVGLGAATVFVVADGVLAYRAWDQGVLREGEGPAFEALKDWQSFTGPLAAVAAAVLAASTRNTQPWAFAVQSDRIDVYGDRTRSTGANDPQLREFNISLGCAIENLVLAAEANGYATTVQLEPGTSQDLVATVTLETGAAVTSELYEAIDQRHSNRSDFTDAPIADGVMVAMSSLSDAGTRVVWFHEASDRAAFADLLVKATRAHINDERHSRDSFLWWRSEWDQIQHHKDGLNVDVIGLPPLLRTLGKILPALSRSKADETFLERTEKQANTAAAFGVITVDDPYTLEQQLHGGRVLQRLHLWAAANDIGFQHMNQITERIDRDRRLNNLRSLEQPLTDLAGPGVLAAFRIGTPTFKSLASPRRPVAEVVR